MVMVEEELRGTRIKECLPSIAYAKAETDRHIREMELRKQNEKLIISPDTLNKLKGEPMKTKTGIASLSDNDILFYLKYCRHNSKFFIEKLQTDSQVYPAIALLAFFRACVKKGTSEGVSSSLAGTFLERMKDFYNTNKGQILTPKTEDALGACLGKHSKYQGKESKPVTLVLPKQKQTYTKLVAIRELSHNVAVFDVAGKSEDYIEGIKTGLSRVFEDTKFVLGEDA